MFCGKYKLDRNLFLSADAFEGSGNIFYYFVDIKRYFIKKKILRVKFVECQEILGKIGKTLGFKQNDFQIFFLHFRRDCSVRHSLYITLDGS